MIKTILVAATGNESDSATFAAALAVARPFGAHLDVLHVKLDATRIALAMATDAGSGALTAGLIEQLETDAADRQMKAQTIFTQFCEKAALTVVSVPPHRTAAAPSAEWHVETGEEPRWMATYGIAADLIVAPRSHGDEASERSVLEAVLLETGRPLLIPAATPMSPSLDRVAIAWKKTPHTARAVALAMPFLMRAREIVVMTVEEGGAEQDAGDDAERLLRNFAWHGFTARCERLTAGSDGAAATLLAIARKQTDLLVMGGYGHSRLREWVFGGFTQQVLVDAPLPVLIAH